MRLTNSGHASANSGFGLLKSNRKAAPADWDVAMAAQSQPAMHFFACLLRGINVGKANRIAMADLKALLEGLGCNQVRTLLASGNVVFASAEKNPVKHAQAIRAAIGAKLDLDVAVIVKSALEFAAVVAEQPVPMVATSAAQTLVAFAQDPADLAGLMAAAPLVVGQEQFVIGQHSATLFCPGGIHDSKAALALLGKVGRAATTRNWATVQKLQALLLEIQKG
jgi:uncharacterized protein (DUF1697 family)